MQKNTIFRQKSLDRISSPDHLDQYIKTTTPAFIILLLAVTIFLLGFLGWAIFGKIETKENLGFTVTDGVIITVIKEDDIDKITDSSYITIDDNNYVITKISSSPSEANSTIISKFSYLFHCANIEEGEWYYFVFANTSLADGEYKGSLVFETISPISFIF